MKEQAVLFKDLTGQEAGRVGMDKALSAESEEWRAKAWKSIIIEAKSGQEFDAEDVRLYVGDPVHKNSMGAILSKAARAGVIKCVGYREARRGSSHGRVLRVWKGK